MVRTGQPAPPYPRWVTIHTEHPFLDPDPDPVRRFRARLGGAVTLWTAADDRGGAGLTVTSVMLAAGEPARLLALLDPDSDLAETLGRSGRAVVSLLAWEHRGMADAFAGVAPAPGGAFRMAGFEDTEWGPRLLTDGSWAGVALESTAEVGWSSLVTCVVEQVVIGADEAALVHRRGRYARAER